MPPVRLTVVALLLLSIAGCAGAPLTIPTEPLRPSEVQLGMAKGSSTGYMLFQFIPIGQNDRFVEAYKDALSKHPGATRLIDVEIREDWLWLWLLNTYTCTVHGMAVREN